MPASWSPLSPSPLTSPPYLTPPPSDTRCPPALRYICGGGACVPLASPGPNGLSYTCSCPPGFINQTNSDGTPVCAEVDVCNGGTFSPCRMGQCLNDGIGGYTCACPPGFRLDYYITLKQLCVPDGVVPFMSQDNLYTAGASDSCASIAVARGLNPKTFLFLNDDLDCSSSLEGALVVVGPTVDTNSSKCATLYQLSTVNDTCTSVASRFGLSLAQLQTLNPGVNVTSCKFFNKTRGLLCVEFGYRSAVDYPCHQYHTILTGESCDGVINTYGVDVLTFFRLNPGVDCDHFTAGDEVCVQSAAPANPQDELPGVQAQLLPAGFPPPPPAIIGAPVSAGLSGASGRRRLLAPACQCANGCHLVRRGDTCVSLCFSYYHCSYRLMEYWNGKVHRGFTCRDAQLIPGVVQLCMPKIPGGCGKA